MQDIRFRAWDKKKNDWFDDNDGDLYIESNGSINFGWDGEIMDDYTDRIVLMQYIGITDIYGVKIYEGDIVMEMKSGDVFEVKYGWFVDLSACYLPEVGAYLYDGHETRPIYKLNYEVIGNVNKNPEMLEDYQ